MKNNKNAWKITNMNELKQTNKKQTRSDICDFLLVLISQNVIEPLFTESLVPILLELIRKDENTRARFVLFFLCFIYVCFSFIHVCFHSCFFSQSRENNQIFKQEIWLCKTIDNFGCCSGSLWRIVAFSKLWNSKKINMNEMKTNKH